MKEYLGILVIFCKWPRLNYGKQRLASSIGASKTFELAKLLVNCVLEDAEIWQGDVVLALSNKDDLELVKEIIDGRAELRNKVTLVIQSSGNLGKRINAIDQELRQEGNADIVFIGTDSPIINQDYFKQIKEALTSSDIVLSQASDGGVIIMANRKAWPDLTFLPWSTDTLSQQLSVICKNSGLTVEYINDGFDIDVIDDLNKLYVTIASDPRQSRNVLYEWLKEYFLSITQKTIRN